MARGTQREWPTDSDLLALCSECDTVTQVAARLGVPRPTLQNHLQRRDLLAAAVAACKAGVARRKSTAPPAGEPRAAAPGQAREVTSDDPAEWGDIRALLESRGLDPDDWAVVRVRVNEWDGFIKDANDEPQVVPLRQLRVDLLPRNPGLILPARSDGWKAPPRRKRPAKRGEPQLIVCLSDAHAPWHEPALHEASLRLIEKVQPHRGVDLGDLTDQPDVSRHRRNPKWNAPLGGCVQGGYDITRGRVEASRDTEWAFIPGNHDFRLRNSVLDHNAALYGLPRASTWEGAGGEDVLSLAHLLRFDELGVQVVDTGGGEYHDGQLLLGPDLLARHGWKTTKGAGASARASLEGLGCNLLVAHTHRQGLSPLTRWDAHDRPVRLVAAEIGCMCRIDGGLGYTRDPDWQQGCAIVATWPSGEFNVDLIPWNGRALLWRGEQFAA